MLGEQLCLRPSSSDVVLSFLLLLKPLLPILVYNASSGTANSVGVDPTLLHPLEPGSDNCF